MSRYAVAVTASYIAFLAVALAPMVGVDPVVALYAPIAAGLIAGLVLAEARRSVTAAALSSILAVLTILAYYAFTAPLEVQNAMLKLGPAFYIPIAYSVAVAALSSLAVTALRPRQDLKRLGQV